MKTSAILALIFLATAFPTKAQQAQSLTDCFPDFSGLACLMAPPRPVMTNADYGTVYVAIRPPESVSQQAVKASKKNWQNWVRRYFLPKTKSGALVAEIYQGTNKIAIIPVSMFSIDEKKGLKIETGNSFISSQQFTPYFRLDSVSNPIKVVLSFRSSQEQGSKIIGTFDMLTGAAKGLGASGYLFTAGVNPVSAALQPIETAITSNFNYNTDNKLDLGFSFENNGGADFSFGFDPSGKDRSGRITFQLIRRGSIFGDFAVINQRPVFPFVGRTDISAANEVLSRPFDGKDIRSKLGSGLIDHSQKITAAAIQIEDMKVWAQRS